MVPSARLLRVTAGLALLASASCSSDAVRDRMRDSGPPPPADELGRPCLVDEDCVSNVCVDVGDRRVCSRVCATEEQCPGGAWLCAPLEGRPLQHCICEPDAATEICDDGRDNDCDGATDDCLMCDGRLIAGDDEAHCGECESACREDQACRNRGCECDNPGAVDCDGVCADLSISANHCGACDRACAPGRICASGACRCPNDAPELCRGECVDVLSDSAHCGACGVACGTGLVCRGGECKCPTELFPDLCPFAGCVNLASDPEHCGECGNVCGAATCVGGACVCPTPTDIVCDGSCVDTQTDLAHCGACGNACAVGAVCNSGECVCPSGVVCAGVCLPADDDMNCGACGLTCGAAQRCTGGTCTCLITSRTACGALCVDASADDLNCGACGIECTGDRSCADGTCVCPGRRLYCPSTDTCVDTQTDPANCGGCDIACLGDQNCDAGSCSCEAPTTRYCASVDRCVDSTSESAHCGACDNACGPALACRESACQCPTVGERFCISVDACVDALTDREHCGACDTLCPPRAFCSGGSCTCPLAEEFPCVAGCADLDTDAFNCGACGNTCSTGLSCLAGDCLCDTTPVVGAARRITWVADNGTKPRLAFGGGRVALVWTETGSSLHHAFLMLLNPDGTDTGIPVVAFANTMPAADASDRHADVVWTGTHFAVVWARRVDRRETVMVQLVAPDGTTLPAHQYDVARRPPDITATFGPSGIVAFFWGDALFYALGSDGSTLTTHPFRTAGSPHSNDGSAGAQSADGTIGVLHSNVGMANDPVFYSVDPTTFDVSMDNLDWLAAASSPVGLIWDGASWVAAYSRLVTSSVAELVLARGPDFADRLVMPSVTATSVRGLHLAGDGASASMIWGETDIGLPWVTRYFFTRFALPETPGGAPVRILGTFPLAGPETRITPTLIATGGGGHVIAWRDQNSFEGQIFVMPLQVSCP